MEILIDMRANKQTPFQFWLSYSFKCFQFLFIRLPKNFVERPKSCRSLNQTDRKVTRGDAAGLAEASCVHRHHNQALIGILLTRNWTILCGPLRSNTKERKGGKEQTRKEGNAEEYPLHLLSLPGYLVLMSYQDVTHRVLFLRMNGAFLIQRLNGG